MFTRCMISFHGKLFSMATSSLSFAGTMKQVPATWSYGPVQDFPSNCGHSVLTFKTTSVELFNKLNSRSKHHKTTILGSWSSEKRKPQQHWGIIQDQVNFPLALSTWSPGWTNYFIGFFSEHLTISLTQSEKFRSRSTEPVNSIFW